MSNDLNGPWVAPLLEGGVEELVTVDPRALVDHQVGVLPCPPNPAPPDGWRYWKGKEKVPGALAAWTLRILKDGKRYPMGAFAQLLHKGELVAARVEWHDRQGATNKKGCFRGVNLLRLKGEAPVIPSAPSTQPTQPTKPTSGAAAKATFGIDLSHHQVSAFQPWDKYQGKVDFVICRASYGGLLRDREVVAHMQHARAIGAKVGLYQFFRPSQSVDQHWDQLRAVADLVKLGDGDLVPALDIELDPLPKPGTSVSKSWAPQCEELVGRMVQTFGDALVYITQREFGLLGSPKWVLQRPLWVAHYTGAAKPATPGNLPATIWQHRVGPFDPQGPGGYDKLHPDLDHNRGLEALPLIGQLPDAGLDDLRDAAVMTLPETTIIGEA